MKESTKEFLRYMVNALAIILVVLIVYSVIEFKKKNNTYPFEERIAGVYKEFLKFLRVEKTNLNIIAAPSRKIPLTFIQREEALRQLNPELFANFSEREWAKFWLLIYEPIQEKQGKYTVKRFRTREEVQNILREKYSSVFGYFKEGQWQELWAAAKISWDDMERKEEGKPY
jgi:hypothetical protein